MKTSGVMTWEKRKEAVASAEFWVVEKLSKQILLIRKFLS